MIGAVIVTHGRVAAELLEATRRIVGPTEAIRAVCIGWEDEIADARQQIEDAVEEVDRDGRVLIFTDMFGGTPTNVSLSFLEKDRLEIITGVNLPMMIKLTGLQSSEESLDEVARQVRDRGQKSVYVASEILSSQEQA